MSDLNLSLLVCGLLRELGVTDTWLSDTDVTDNAASLCVAIYDALFITKLPNIRRRPDTLEDDIWNAQVVLDALRSHVGEGVVPDGISGESIARGDRSSIALIFSLLNDIHNWMKVQQEQHQLAAQDALHLPVPDEMRTPAYDEATLRHSEQAHTAESGDGTDADTRLSHSHTVITPAVRPLGVGHPKSGEADDALFSDKQDNVRPSTATTATAHSAKGGGSSISSGQASSTAWHAVSAPGRNQVTIAHQTALQQRQKIGAPGQRSPTAAADAHVYAHVATAPVRPLPVTKALSGLGSKPLRRKAASPPAEPSSIQAPVVPMREHSSSSDSKEQIFPDREGIGRPATAPHSQARTSRGGSTKAAPIDSRMKPRNNRLQRSIPPQIPPVVHSPVAAPKPAREAAGRRSSGGDTMPHGATQLGKASVARPQARRAVSQGVTVRPPSVPASVGTSGSNQHQAPPLATSTQTNRPQTARSSSRSAAVKKQQQQPPPPVRRPVSAAGGLDLRSRNKLAPRQRLDAKQAARSANATAILRRQRVLLQKLHEQSQHELRHIAELHELAREEQASTFLRMELTALRQATLRARAARHERQVLVIRTQRACEDLARHTLSLRISRSSKQSAAAAELLKAYSKQAKAAAAEQLKAAADMRAQELLADKTSVAAIAHAAAIAAEVAREETANQFTQRQAALRNQREALSRAVREMRVDQEALIRAIKEQQTQAEDAFTAQYIDTINPKMTRHAGPPDAADMLQQHLRMRDSALDRDSSPPDEGAARDPHVERTLLRHQAALQKNEAAFESAVKAGVKLTAEAANFAQKQLDGLSPVRARQTAQQASDA